MSQSAPTLPSVGLQALVEEYFQQCYNEHPDRHHFFLQKSQLGDMLGSTTSSTLRYNDVEKVLHCMPLQLEGDIFAPSRECAVLVSPSLGERGGFKIYGIMRRPKVLEAIIHLGVEMIQWQMKAEDVDAPPVEITFRLADAYSVWYDKQTKATYARYIAREITTRLQRGETKIIATWNEEGSTFECRRT